jgi:chromosome segregation protein
VQEREERCRIVEQELLVSRQKLERDCTKARTYQQLRDRLHLGRLQEQVLGFEVAQEQLQGLRRRQETLSQKEVDERSAVAAAQAALAVGQQELEALQAEVKALGEDSLLAVQAELAGLEASGRELTRQAERHQSRAEESATPAPRTGPPARGPARPATGPRRPGRWRRPGPGRGRLPCRRSGGGALTAAPGEVAGRSGSWLEEQKQRSRQRQELQTQLAPLVAEEQQLSERLRQDQERLRELGEQLQVETGQSQGVQAGLVALEGNGSSCSPAWSASNNASASWWRP